MCSLFIFIFKISFIKTSIQTYKNIFTFAASNLKIVIMNWAYLQHLDIFSWQIITLLIVSGFLVGVVNTLAGSGTIIGYSVFMFLGLPANYANGTVRLGVILQTLAAWITFKKQKALDLRKGMILSISCTIGSIAGALLAIKINKDVFEVIIGIVMVLMLVFIFIKPERWIKGKESLTRKKLTWKQHVLFFAIGFYGGFIHIGLGIFLLAALVMSTGYDLVKANALKIFIVFVYSPFALSIFILGGQISYTMGLISAIGNLLGGIAASYYAVRKGAEFVRWVLIIVIVLFTANLFGLTDLIFG